MEILLLHLQLLRLLLLRLQATSFAGSGFGSKLDDCVSSWIPVKKCSFNLLVFDESLVSDLGIA